ncbi:MAG: MarC family protein [Nitrospirota bacterium]|mgnify:CR=1 FL=1
MAINFTDILGSFLLSIIPIMVAIDAPGVLPIYIGMTEGMERDERKRIAFQSVFTAFLIATAFIFLGRAVFNTLGIEVEDFMIGGGILLLIISIADIVRLEDRWAKVPPTLGVVPLGTPLLAGPATLTTTLMLVGNYGYLPVILSLILNLILAWIIFNRAEIIIRLIGINGARAFAKIASLLLAAIAVKFIRMGIFKIMG